MENEKKIYLIGDSVMKGVTYFGDPARYRLCPGERYRKLEESGVQVKNLSKMFATIRFADSLLDDKLLSNLNDSKVVLGFGGNDSDYDWDSISSDPFSKHLPHTPEETYGSVYLSCIDRLRSAGAEVYIANMVPIDAGRYLERISEGRDRNNILLWLGDEEMLYRWHEHYDRITENIANTKGCRIVDVRGAFLTRHGFKDLICPDGIHPTVEGHKLIEDVLTDTVLAS